MPNGSSLSRIYRVRSRVAALVLTRPENWSMRCATCCAAASPGGPAPSPPPTGPVSAPSSVRTPPGASGPPRPARASSASTEPAPAHGDEQQVERAAPRERLRDTRGDAPGAARQDDHLGAGELLLPRREGFRPELDDAPALAAAIRRLLDSPDLTQRIAATGRREYDADFTEAKVVERYLAFYGRMIGERRPA